MSTIPTTEPLTLRQGDAVTWRRELPDYPASAGWVLHYRLLWRSPSPASFDAVADGDAHLVTLSAATTAAWQYGPATMVAWVTRLAERYTVAQLQVQVERDVTAATSLDDRSTARRQLEAAQAALLAYLEGGKAHVAEYDIAGRRMKFRSAQEIEALIQSLRRQVAAEHNAAALMQGVVPGRIYTRN